MRIGCCGDINGMALIQRIGFDFVELSVQALEPLGADHALREHMDALERLTIRPEAFNGFLPGDLKVTGPAADLDALDRYVMVALERVAALGGEIVVFGSGTARRIPDGFSRERAVQQVDDFLRRTGDRAEKHGITLAIEPLRSQESNIINSVAEGAQFAARIQHPRVTVLADFYHMDAEAEPLHNVAVPDRLTHVHLADTRRRAPGTGSYPYDAFAAALKDARYTGRISCECMWDDLAAQGPAALAFLREKFADA